MKVAVCTPHGGSVQPGWQRAISNVFSSTPNYEYVMIDVDMMIVGKARNMCVEAAIQAEADIAWFVDDDVYPPEGASILLDQVHSLGGIVSGMYFQRRPPYTPQAYQLANEENVKGMYWPYIDYPDNQIFEVDACGAGCLVITMEVLHAIREHASRVYKEESEKISVPWLSTLVSKMSPWFEFLDAKGEDFYFCERAKDAGFRIFMNSSVKCVHMGELPVGEEHFKYLRDKGLLVKEPIPG